PQAEFGALNGGGHPRGREILALNPLAEKGIELGQVRSWKICFGHRGLIPPGLPSFGNSPRRTSGLMREGAPSGVVFSTSGISGFSGTAGADCRGCCLSVSISA